MMTNLQHLMLIAMEECNEVSQRLSKAIRFGLDEVYPETGKTNAKSLAEEIADLFTTLEMINEIRPIEPGWDSSDHEEKKRAKIKKYMEYSRSLGQLEDVQVSDD